MNENEEFRIGDVVVDRIGKRVGIVIGFDERRDHAIYLLTCSNGRYFQTLESSKHMWTKTGIHESAISNIMDILNSDRL